MPRNYKPDQIVIIQNPLPGSASNKTHLKRAEKLVKRGRAVFVAPLIIRFLLDDPLQSLHRSASDGLTQRITGRGYDLVNGDYHRCARAIPVIHPELMQ